MSLREFMPDRSGHVLAVFAFLLVPALAFVGAGIDLQIRLQRQIKTQAVLDAAVLAGSKALQTGASSKDITTTIVNFVSQQIRSEPGLICETPTVRIPSGGTTIEAELNCTQSTSLMHLMGHEQLPVKVDSTSTYSITAIDVAFMFDVSGSMNSNNRLVDLRSATTEALDILLPRSASVDVVENTRIAMSSYGSMLNAGAFFEQVTGLTPTRSYTETVVVEMDDHSVASGYRFSAVRIYLYDADSGDRIAELGNNAVIKVKPEQLRSITIVVEPKSGHHHYDDFESFEFRLTGPETENSSESVAPYSLYGDSGMSHLTGKQWSTGEYELTLLGFDGIGLTGNKLFDKSLRFELFKKGEIKETDQSFTLTSTCVWERDGQEKSTDAPPGPDNYLAAHNAWYHQISPNSPDGYWKVGFNENGEFRSTGPTCLYPEPVELTNNRNTLDTYVSTLRATGFTAGHLGVAWSWYLISDRWSSVFDDTATPAAFTDTNIKKAVILMTDGAFNVVGHTGQGNSAAQARALCNGMKAKGVIIYAVAFKAPQAGRDVLRNCATNTHTFFNARNRQELTDAYKRIAVELSDIRISK